MTFPVANAHYLRKGQLIFPLMILMYLTGREACAQSNFNVLHYTETSGFDHGTRGSSYMMLADLGSDYGFSVDDDSTGATFSSLQDLEAYSVIVFSNTSGDQILDSAQRAHFEQWIDQGGSVVGIHSATDTYRHSTANGSNTGTWDFYAETLGGSVQANPHHTAAGYNGTMDVVQNHPATAHIPDPWNKAEELLGKWLSR